MSKGLEHRAEEFVFSAQNYEEIFHNMLDPVVIYEIDEQNSFVQMLDANLAFFEMYGYVEEDLDTLDFSLITAEGKRVYHYIKEIANKGTFLFKTKHKTSSGKIFPVEVHSHCITLSEKKVIVSIIRDISVRERDRERLLALNEAKDNILKIVSHDLRSPLAQIHGILQLMQTENLSEPMKRYLGLLDESRIHAENILAELLTSGDVENAQEELKLEKISVNGFCKKILPHYEIYSHSKKNIRIQYDLPQNDQQIEVDVQKLIRVFDNIISNAVKFSHVGSLLNFGWQPCAGQVQFSVRDYGIGIPEKLKTKIFDRHTEAKRLGTKGEKTIGLGMHISKSIIERHGGKIWFESQENEGATFFVSLPGA